MTDQEVRIAVARLPHKRREAAKLALRMRPSIATKGGRRHNQGLPRVLSKCVTLSIRTTPEEYLALKRYAKRHRTSISEVVRAVGVDRVRRSEL